MKKYSWVLLLILLLQGLWLFRFKADERAFYRDELPMTAAYYDTLERDVEEYACFGYTFLRYQHDYGEDGVELHGGFFFFVQSMLTVTEVGYLLYYGTEKLRHRAQDDAAKN